MNTFQNLGNTCYLNAGLQALFSISSLTSCFHLNFTVDNIDTKIVEELITLYLKKQQPHTLYELYLRKYNIQRNAPEDTSEFIQRILDSLEFFDCSQEMENVIENTCFCSKLWNSKKKSIVKDLFLGMVSDDLFFPCCNSLIHHVEFFTILPVHPSDSLSNCLRNMITCEIIQNVQCDKCNKNTTISKIKNFHHFPKILIFDISIGTPLKIEKSLLIQHEHNEKKVYHYILKNITLLNHGHYTSIVFRDGNYYYINDTQYTDSNIEQYIKNNHARLLIYERD